MKTLAVSRSFGQYYSDTCGVNNLALTVDRERKVIKDESAKLLALLRATSFLIGIRDKLGLFRFERSSSSTSKVTLDGRLLLEGVYGLVLCYSNRSHPSVNQASITCEKATTHHKLPNCLSRPLSVNTSCLFSRISPQYIRFNTINLI